MKIVRIGLDLAKNMFSLCGVEEQGKERKTLRRDQVLARFALLPPAVVGMEAGSGVHYWARELLKLGHSVFACVTSNSGSPTPRSTRGWPNPCAP